MVICKRFQKVRSEMYRRHHWETVCLLSIAHILLLLIFRNITLHVAKQNTRILLRALYSRWWSLDQSLLEWKWRNRVPISLTSQLLYSMPRHLECRVQTEPCSAKNVGRKLCLQCLRSWLESTCNLRSTIPNASKLYNRYMSITFLVSLLPQLLFLALLHF